MQNTSRRVRTRAQTRTVAATKAFHSLPDNVWRTHIYPHLSPREQASLSRASKQRHNNVRKLNQFRLDAATAKAINAAATKLMYTFTRGIAAAQKARREHNHNWYFEKKTDVGGHFPTMYFVTEMTLPSDTWFVVFFFWGPVEEGVPNVPRPQALIKFTATKARGRKILMKSPEWWPDNSQRPFDKAMKSLSARILNHAIKLYNQRPVLS